jgi:hypothetical protein
MTLLADTSIRSTVGLALDLWLVFAAYWSLVTWHLVRGLRTWRVRAVLLAVTFGPIGYGVGRVARRRERSVGPIDLDDDLGGNDGDVDGTVDWTRL